MPSRLAEVLPAAKSETEVSAELEVDGELKFPLLSSNASKLATINFVKRVTLFGRSLVCGEEN